MINRTRITVDEATREVLDQLSTELARTPSWTQQLSDDVRQVIKEALRDSQAGQERALVPIAASTRALQAQIGQQADGIAAVGEQMQTMAARIASLQAASSSQAELIAGLHDPIDSLNERFERQAQSIDRLGQDLACLTELAAQGCSALAVQRQALDALKGDCQSIAGQQVASQAELAGILQQLATTVRDIRSEQSDQRDALQLLSTTLDSLSQSWWKLIFFPRRSKS